MIDDILQEITLSADPISLVEDIEPAGIPDLSLDAPKREGKDIFHTQQRQSWDKTVEARCDFAYKPRITRRADTTFISIWQKSVFGRTLTDIKADDEMVTYFVDNLLPMIWDTLGRHLSAGNWAIVTTPMRRHKERNFASMIAKGLASKLGIPFYFDCAHCENRHRVGAVFSSNNIPREPNVIVFDDFVTTGSTLLAMKNLLESEGKNPIFFAGINNKL